MQELQITRLSNVTPRPPAQLWEVTDDTITTEMGGYEYAIPLRDTDTREKVLDWVAHLSAKKWMTTEGLKQFASLLMRERK
tara:strand:+ start:1962 stop:2204 length:243 start_codon:yes stop_codon:yes gene_type:complete